MPILLSHSFVLVVKRPSLEVLQILERESMLGRFIKSYLHITKLRSKLNYFLSILGRESQSLSLLMAIPYIKNRIMWKKVPIVTHVAIMIPTKLQL